MKNLTLLFLVIGLISCKKDPVNPGSPVTPQPPTPGANYIIADGYTLTNDTFQFPNYNYGAFNATSPDSMTVICNRDTLASPENMVCIFTSLQSVGIDTINPNSSSWSPTVSIAGIGLFNIETVITITRCDAVGGLIEGTYSGRWVNLSSDTVQANGVFSVPRLQ